MTARPSLTLLPAVDVAGGRAAQVVSGGDDDPYAVAMGWVEQGAQWIHLVDLDRAYGRPTADSSALLADLVERIPVPVQLSGGLADADSIGWAAQTGAARLVLASSVLADPGLVAQGAERFGGRLVVAVDVSGGRVVSRGTDLDLGRVEEVLADHPVAGPGVKHVLVADASRDGSRAGSDVDLFARVAELVAADVIASGGVGTLDDLTALAGLADRGVTAAVLGSALYHDAFTLEQALAACR